MGPKTAIWSLPPAHGFVCTFSSTSKQSSYMSWWRVHKHRRLSYGTGRPAILKDDESIWQCRLLLQHPLAIEDDMRLVSTVELMAIRESVHNKLSPFDRPVDEVTFDVLEQADLEFSNWYKTWDQAFSQKYEDAGESSTVVGLRLPEYSP